MDHHVLVLSPSDEHLGPLCFSMESVEPRRPLLSVWFPEMPLLGGGCTGGRLERGWWWRAAFRGRCQVRSLEALRATTVGELP